MPDAAPDVGVIVVGGDALALSTAHEICLLPGHRVAVLWAADPQFAAAVEAIGARFVAGRADNRDDLVRAGVEDASSILALSRDDAVNLQSALRARDTNPRIHIVLRQFNLTLAAKIEQNLPDCSVLSLAHHSAATYTAAALDPSCLRGLQFPEPSGPLTGFVQRSAGRDGLAGRSVSDAETALGARIVAVDGRTEFNPDEPLGPDARLIAYGTIERLLASTPRQPDARSAPLMREWLRRRFRRPPRRRRLDPYIAGLAAAAIALFIIGTWHFHDALHSDWLTAAYFVATTITTTGYGDIAPNHSNPVDVGMAMALMLLGTIFTGMFIAIVSARLTRMQWVHMQGLRPIHRRGHVVVCGSGSIGSEVVELLLALKQRTVVIEQTPDAALVERARDRGFDLLTGDASRDATLDLCNLQAAHSLVALTNVDTLNLEIALGARARNPNMPIVLRIAGATFAASIARHFQFETTFSVAALAGPAFAGLSVVSGARGRVAFEGQEFAIAELVVGEPGWAALPRIAIPLAAAGPDGAFRFVRDLGELHDGDRVLILAPLAPFRDGRERMPDIAERVAGA